MSIQDKLTWTYVVLHQQHTFPWSYHKHMFHFPSPSNWIPKNTNHRLFKCIKFETKKTTKSTLKLFGDYHHFHMCLYSKIFKCLFLHYVIIFHAQPNIFKKIDMCNHKNLPWTFISLTFYIQNTQKKNNKKDFCLVA